MLSSLLLSRTPLRTAGRIRSTRPRTVVFSSCSAAAIDIYPNRYDGRSGRIPVASTSFSRRLCHHCAHEPWRAISWPSTRALATCVGLGPGASDRWERGYSQSGLPCTVEIGVRLWSSSRRRDRVWMRVLRGLLRAPAEPMPPFTQPNAAEATLACVGAGYQRLAEIGSAQEDACVGAIAASIPLVTGATGHGEASSGSVWWKRPRTRTIGTWVERAHQHRLRWRAWDIIAVNGGSERAAVGSFLSPTTLAGAVG